MTHVTEYRERCQPSQACRMYGEQHGSDGDEGTLEAVGHSLEPLQVASASKDPLRGFMRTGAPVVSLEPSLRFRGEVLELMRGKGLDTILEKRDQRVGISYVRRMLSEVFHALAAAQDTLGFRHWDLRLANVMQHDSGLGQVSSRIDPNSVLSDAEEQPGEVQDPDGERLGHVPSDNRRFCFKIIDFGHAELQKRDLVSPFPDIRLPATSFTERCYRLFWAGRGDVYRLLMSLQNVIDGWTWAGEDQVGVERLQSLILEATG